jgi:nucleoside-triphosphatase THEP1
MPDPTVQLFVIDEIGRMGCLSAKFVSAVGSPLALGRALLPTAALVAKQSRINGATRIANSGRADS